MLNELLSLNLDFLHASHAVDYSITNVWELCLSVHALRSEGVRNLPTRPRIVKKR